MNPALTPEDRERILTEIHQRQVLEQQALTEEKTARQQQAELEYRQSLADAARRAEEERTERLESNLTTCIELIQDALQVFQQGNETECYRLLVKTDSFFIAAKQQINQLPEHPKGGSVPTIKIKADNRLGYALINSEDFIEGVHQIYQEGPNEY